MGGATAVAHMSGCKSTDFGSCQSSMRKSAGPQHLVAALATLSVEGVHPSSAPLPPQAPRLPLLLSLPPLPPAPPSSLHMPAALLLLLQVAARAHWVLRAEDLVARPALCSSFATIKCMDREAYCLSTYVQC